MLAIGPAATLALGACGGPLSTLDTAGPVAGSIATFWWVSFWGAAVIFLLVMALFALATAWPGAAARAGPRAWIVWGGLVLPALVLPPLVGFAFVQGEQLLPRPGADVVRVRAEGFQWGWDFRYPDHGGGTSRDVLHLPAGEPVDILITSRDVIHSFWVPQLAGKLDAIPGHTNVLRLFADAPGRLEALCAEFCGVGHTGMRFEVVVHAAEDYPDALAEALAQ